MNYNVGWIHYSVGWMRRGLEHTGQQSLRFQRSAVMDWIQDFITSSDRLGGRPLPLLRRRFPRYLWKSYLLVETGGKEGMVEIIAKADFAWVFTNYSSLVTARDKSRQAPLARCFYSEFCRGVFPERCRDRGVIFVVSDKKISENLALLSIRSEN